MLTNSLLHPIDASDCNVYLVLSQIMALTLGTRYAPPAACIIKFFSIIKTIIGAFLTLTLWNIANGL